jgi:N-acylneuraminate cytidylyltransferase
MSSVAIITARGGSKRIPRKNVRDFCGQPIISYSIRAALESGCFQEVMVSTDDDEIAAIAKRFGASVPFMRSKKNSDDFSSTTDVLEEVILEYRKRAREFDSLCCIYPTAPLVSAQRLKQAHDAFVLSGADTVFSIVRFGYPVWRGFKIENGYAKMIWPENYDKRSQDLPPAYHDAGQFYFIRSNSLLKTKTIFTDRTLGIEIPESEAQDIDTEEDWKIAELKFRLLQDK